MLVDSPSPMALLRCCTRKSLPSKIPLQPWEEDGDCSTMRKGELLQYFPIRMRDRRQSGFLSRCHDILASRPD